MKDPAFLFYSSDFLSGVSDLTMEERGKYITLLCLQHQKGRLSKKAIDIATANATADVLAKFRQDENGKYYNERLEIEAKKRADHAEKQRQRALKGWEKRKKEGKKNNDATANATALPLENVNENIIYLQFNHLILYYEQFEKLIESGYSKDEIDEVMEQIENYKNNKKYKSLYLTAKNWLKKNKENQKSKPKIHKPTKEDYENYFKSPQQIADEQRQKQQQ